LNRVARAVSFSLRVRQRGLAPERSEVPVPFDLPRVTRSASEMGTGTWPSPAGASPHFRGRPRTKQPCIVADRTCGNGGRSATMSPSWSEGSSTPETIRTLQWFVPILVKPISVGGFRDSGSKIVSVCSSSRRQPLRKKKNLESRPGFGRRSWADRERFGYSGARSNRSRGEEKGDWLAALDEKSEP
jgi:hypothetical protein